MLHVEGYDVKKYILNFFLDFNLPCVFSSHKKKKNYARQIKNIENYNKIV